MSKEKIKKKFNQSYGMILYSDQFLETRFLIIQRRNTYEFEDLIRGKWNSYGDLKNLVESLSEKEKKKMLKYDYSKLWNDVFFNYENTKVGNMVYQLAYKKYQQKEKMIKNLIESSGLSNKTSPWGFPKGRKEITDKTSRDTAIRELSEETTIDISDLIFLDHVRPIIELYIGKDGNEYKNTYYIAKAEILEVKKKKINKDGIKRNLISDEVNDMKWISYKDAKDYLNPLQIEILSLVVQQIKNKE